MRPLSPLLFIPLLLAACQQPGEMMARLVERQGGVTTAPYKDPDLEAFDQAFKAVAARPAEDDLAVMADIAARRDTLEPPYFYELARRLLPRDPEAALEWFAFGQIRARYDALRCSDDTAGDYVFALPQLAPGVTRHAEDNLSDYGEAGLRAVAQPALFSGRASPWWVCARTETAVRRAAAGESARSDGWLRPEDDWPGLQQALREGMAASYARLAGRPADAVAE